MRIVRAKGYSGASGRNIVIVAWLGSVGRARSRRDDAEAAGGLESESGGGQVGISAPKTTSSKLARIEMGAGQ